MTTRDKRARTFLDDLFGGEARMRATKTSRYRTCQLWTGRTGGDCDGWWYDDGEDTSYPLT
jgi:hypothetical protein